MTLKAVRSEKGIWAIDDPTNGFSYSDNILVAGIPDMIEFLTNNNPAYLQIEENEFEGSYRLDLQPIKGGTDCWLNVTPFSKMKGWLCPVFNHYFPIVPDHIWIKVS